MNTKIKAGKSIFMIGKIGHLSTNKTLSSPKVSIAFSSSIFFRVCFIFWLMINNYIIEKSIFFSIFFLIKSKDFIKILLKYTKIRKKIGLYR